MEVFEGKKGFMETVAGDFAIDWSKEDLERVTQTILKKYNAEVHAQSTIEGILELKRQYGLTAEKIERIEVETFDVAYNIIGGGEEGDKSQVRTKEEADHSLPYLVAVALLDGQVMPEQYLPDRIVRADVQELIRRVVVRSREDYSRRFPKEMPSRIVVRMKHGSVFERDKHDYEGFLTRPAGWKTAVEKFQGLSERYASASLRKKIVNVVDNFEDLRVADLVKLLSRVRRSKGG